MSSLYNQIDESNVLSIESDNASFDIVKVSDFLTKEQRDDIFNCLCENEEDFSPMGEGILTKHLFLRSKFNEEQFENLNDACEPLSTRILEIMPDIFSVLKVEPFPITKLRFNFIHGLDGHYGDPHSDDYGFGLDVTLLYYFHERPKAFTGGDLEFYDNLEDKNMIKKIDYEDNLFIAFSSDKVHAVTKVLCDSQNFEDGRFLALTFIGKDKKQDTSNVM